MAFAIALAALLFLRQLWATDLGFDEAIHAKHRIVTGVDPSGPAARGGIVVGDEILWDPGLDTYRADWSNHNVYAWSWRRGDALRSGHVPMRILHEGVERTVDVVPDGPTISATLRQLRLAGATLPTAFAFLAVAALLARRATRDETARRTLAYSFALFGPCYVINFPSPSWPRAMIVVATVVLNVFSIAAVAAMTWFAWSFPKRARMLDRAWAKSVLVVLSATAAVLSLLDGAGWIVFPQAQLGWNMLLALVTIVGLVWQRRRATGPVARRQASLLLVAVILGYSVPIFGTVLPIMLGLADVLAFVLFFPFSLLIPVAFASAVARYRLFDLDGLASKAGFHTMVVGTSLLVYAFVASTVALALAPLGPGSAEAGRLLAIGTIVALGEPLRALTRRTIDRLFAVDRAERLARCSTLAARIAGIDEPGAIEAAVREALGARTVVLSVTDVLPTATRAGVLREVARRGAVRVVQLGDASVVDALLAMDIDTLVCVTAGANDTRALGLSSPLDPRDHAERDALANVGRIIGNALAQRTARGVLEARVSRVEDERKRIAMDLHDGVGATLTSARLMTQAARRSHDRDDALDALESTLQEGLSDLRIALWSLDEEDIGWPPLFARLRRQCSDMCAAASIRFEMNIDVTDVEDPSPVVRMTVLRLVKEAVTNVLRHAQATRLAIRVTRVGHELSIAIEDDGVGAVAPRPDGRGLGNMQRRARDAGGTLAVEARDGGGTRVLALLPFASPRAAVA
ncbi:MAG: two-component sensor histidine kinase [Myxococcaceae bacterium]|nr:two-component sensor histidine kinase [Myxococcaceae bacterium]